MHTFKIQHLVSLNITYTHHSNEANEHIITSKVSWSPSVTSPFSLWTTTDMLSAFEDELPFLEFYRNGILGYILFFCMAF